MSNIPFNTVASLLGTAQVQRQVSAVNDRKLHDAVRSQKQQTQRVRERNEAVEDPAEYGLHAVDDGPQERKREGEQQGEEGKPRGERVEIAGLEAGEAPKAIEEEAYQSPRLDISA